MNKHFKNNPDLLEYFETSDGQAFYKKQDAKNYAKGLTDKSVSKVERTSEDDENQEESGKKGKKTAVEQIEAISLVDTLEGLAPFESDKRATVVAALEERRKVLIENAE
ncbi:hypothetical protein [Sphingobacterium siyangense]|uniref:Uncharacterized protein n=1 Tax=Sphingobacterium siyangense TaxID=459529 RepID=A0A562MQN8_9SPHI|nr:hypothetical protein [Sphingobacterium siyangense]TWI22196.1 hypothetical protein IQ31_01601 [Sphingobacterium siyangense]